MSIPHVGSWFEAVLVSLTAALVTLLSFIPAIIGAAIILIVGWIISGIVARLVTGLLARTGFNPAAERIGVNRFMANAGMRNTTAADVAGTIVKWFIRLIFLEAAAQALHLTAVTELFNRILFFIPNLVVALVVLMLGALIGKVVAEIVQGAAGSAGFSSPQLLGKIAQYAIVGFAVLIAVNQVGIASSLVNILFIAIVGSLALATGLAFGLGGRDTAGQMVQSWYQKGQEAAPRIQHAAQAQGQASPPQVEGTTTVIPPPAPDPQRRWKVNPE